MDQKFKTKENHVFFSEQIERIYAHTKKHISSHPIEHPSVDTKFVDHVLTYKAVGTRYPKHFGTVKYTVGRR